MAASSEISAEFLENEFAKLKERSWQSWTDSEKDLSEFVKRTATAYIQGGQKGTNYPQL